MLVYNLQMLFDTISLKTIHIMIDPLCIFNGQRLELNSMTLKIVLVNSADTGDFCMLEKKSLSELWTWIPLMIEISGSAHVNAV